MSEQPYNRPPITEAIIEMRFAEALKEKELNEVSSDFASVYANHQSITSHGLAVGTSTNDPNETLAHINVMQGNRYSSSDETEIALIWPGSLIVSQLAPYPGWDNFFGRFIRDWKAWKKSLGYRKIARVGVRFINRIDIPNRGGVVQESEYLFAYPKIPDALGPSIDFGMQAQSLPDQEGVYTLLNFASVPSPLLGYISIVLDLDVAIEVNVPQSDDKIFDLLGKLRIKKNAAFEACITDQARELFQ